MAFYGGIMANHNIQAADVAAHDVRLTANTVETFTFVNDDTTDVEVLTDGAADIYLTLDGSTPTVSGANTVKLQAAMGSVVVQPDTAGPDTVIKMITAGSPVVSVGRPAGLS